MAESTCLPGCAPVVPGTLPVLPPARPGETADGTATGVDCNGVAVTVTGASVVQTVPHPNSVQMVKLCDDDGFSQEIVCAPDGTRVIAVISYDPVTGVPTTSYYNLDGSPYTGDVTQLGACAGGDETQLSSQAMCDNGTVNFLRWFVIENGQPTGQSFNTDLTGAPYLPTGAVSFGACATAQRDVDILPVCIIDDATGSVLDNAVAEILYDGDGKRVGLARVVNAFTGQDIDVPAGAHVGLCPDCGGCNDIVLCDSAIIPIQLGAVQIADPRPIVIAAIGNWLPRDRINPNPVQPLFTTGGTCFFPVINNSYTAGVHNWSAATLIAPDGITSTDGEVRISISLRITNDGPDSQTGGGTGIVLINDNNIVSYNTPSVPAGFSAGNSLTTTITGTVPLGDFMAGKTCLLFQAEGSQGATRKSWTVDQLNSAGTTILAVGAGTSFTRTICRDCSGNVTSTIDTTLTGDPYVPTNPVVSCALVENPCKDCAPVGKVCYNLDIGMPVTDNWSGSSITNVGAAYTYIKPNFGGTGDDVLFYAEDSTGGLNGGTYPVIGGGAGANPSVSCALSFMGKSRRDVVVRIGVFGTTSNELIRDINPAPTSISGDGVLVGGNGVDPTTPDGTVTLNFAGPVSDIVFTWSSTASAASMVEDLTFTPELIQKRTLTVLRCCDESVLYVDSELGVEIDPVGLDIVSCVDEEQPTASCLDCETIVLCDTGANRKGLLSGTVSSGSLINGVTWSASGSSPMSAGKTNSDGAWWGLGVFPNTVTPVTTFAFSKPVCAEFSVVMRYVTGDVNTSQLPAGVEVVSLPAGYMFDPVLNRVSVDASTLVSTDCASLINPSKSASARFRISSPVSAFAVQYLGARTSICGVFGNFAFGAIEVVPQGQFIRKICFDCNGDHSSTSDTELDGSTPYTSIGPAAKCGSTPLLSGQSVAPTDTQVGTGILRVTDTAAHDIKALTPGLQTITLTVIAGTVTVSATSGPAVIPSGVNLTWSVSNDDDSSLSAWTATGATGPDYIINWTYKGTAAG